MATPALTLAGQERDSIELGCPALDLDESPSILDLGPTETLVLEVGEELLDWMSGANQHQIEGLRRNLSAQLGFPVPEVGVHHDSYLRPDQYVIRMQGLVVAGGMVKPGRLLAIGHPACLERLVGSSTLDPVCGLPGLWLEPGHASAADTLGCLVVDVNAVLLSHLGEVCRRHIGSLITPESMRGLLKELADELPATVAAVESACALWVLSEVYRALLEEGVSVRDHEVILNALAEGYAPLPELVRRCRKALAGAICASYMNESGAILAVDLEPTVEAGLLEALSPWGSLPEVCRSLFLPALTMVKARGHRPVLVVGPALRAPLRTLLAGEHAVVLSRDEIPGHLQTESLLTISLKPTG